MSEIQRIGINWPSGGGGEGCCSSSNKQHNNPKEIWKG